MSARVADLAQVAERAGLRRHGAAVHARPCSVFEIISRQTGLNFIFDKDVPADARATIYVSDTSIDEVMRIMLVTNQLERKVLNENSVLIYPNTPNKARDYKDLVVRSFYLTNADVKPTATMVRQLVKTRDLFVDEKLNLLDARHAGGDPHGREADRQPGQERARGDDGGRGARGGREPAHPARHRVARAVAIGLQGAGGVPGQLTGQEPRT